jgi:large subunit ribosomal protein L6
MSRIGKKPVVIPDGVEVKIDGQVVTAKGPLGTETVELRSEVVVKLEGNELIVTVVDENDRKARSLWGLSRTLIDNAVQGVKTGLQKNWKSLVLVIVLTWKVITLT